MGGVCSALLGPSSNTAWQEVSLTGTPLPPPHPDPMLLRSELQVPFMYRLEILRGGGGAGNKRWVDGRAAARGRRASPGPPP